MRPAARWEKKPPPPPLAFVSGLAAAGAALDAAPGAAFAEASVVLVPEDGFAVDVEDDPGDDGLAADAVLDEDDDAPGVAEADEAVPLLPVAGAGDAGAFTSVALRSSVACGRFAPGLSVRPASFAGSGLSVMGAGSPGALGSDLEGGRGGT